jgi:hypothetical protein
VFGKRRCGDSKAIVNAHARARVPHTHCHAAKQVSSAPQGSLDCARLDWARLAPLGMTFFGVSANPETSVWFTHTKTQIPRSARDDRQLEFWLVAHGMTDICNSRGRSRECPRLCTAVSIASGGWALFNATQRGR